MEILLNDSAFSGSEHEILQSTIVARVLVAITAEHLFGE